MKQTGVKIQSNGMYCEKCNANLNDEGSTQFVMHMDGRQSYTNVFKCTKCGNMITQEYKRTGMNRKLWE